MKRLFDQDPITKTAKFFRYDHTDDSCSIETIQDVTPVVELTKAEFATMDERAPWKKDMVRVASIPLTEVGKLMAAGIWQDDKKLRRWLNDRDNNAFRTRPGAL